MIEKIAAELSLPSTKIHAVLNLLSEGATIPFIARYRKERTGNLDEVQITDIRDRHEYITELEQKKESYLKEIADQGKLTDELNAKILASETKQRLEDLYLPYRPKRKTRGVKAKELGLEPLADLIRNRETHETFFDGFKPFQTGEITKEKCIDGALDIIAEKISEDAELLNAIRELGWKFGSISSKKTEEFSEKKTKFDNYGNFTQAIRVLPAHRFLAIRRGRKEGILSSELDLPDEQILETVREHVIQNKDGKSDLLELALNDSYKRLIKPSLNLFLQTELKESSDKESIENFSKSLRQLLLMPYAGNVPVLGVDPGFRTGCKWASVSGDGKLLEHGTIFPVEPRKEVEKSSQAVLAQIQKHDIKFICIGNGTASRETEDFIRDMVENYELKDVTPVVVNETGASVYSASKIARKEFPDLDLTVRGAISIGKRFQDPLAELVKIDPKSVGVGQYQHDVNQTKLGRALNETVESCVNSVGVNLNTASASLLSYVAGIGDVQAERIVSHRYANKSFKTRDELLNVERFGPKAFEQCAGFLRIPDSENLLDRTGIHPERYEIVETIVRDNGVSLSDFCTNLDLIKSVRKKSSRYLSENLGMETWNDIFDELEKPGRDPRSKFEAPKFEKNIRKLSDLTPGLILEGVVTNITRFGAFIDIGVHQDGLVHVSELSDNFVKTPEDAVTIGQKVKARVLEVNEDLKRVSLSLKSELPKRTGKPNRKLNKNKGKKVEEGHSDKKRPPRSERQTTNNIGSLKQQLLEKYGKR